MLLEKLSFGVQGVTRSYPLNTKKRELPGLSRTTPEKFLKIY